MQSKFKIKISAPQHVLPWKHRTAPKIAQEAITRNFHLSKYLNKIQVNFTSYDFI